MIKKLHDFGVRSEHAYIGGFASIGLTYLSYFASRKKKGDDKAQADRWESSSAIGLRRSLPSGSR